MEVNVYSAFIDNFVKERNSSMDFDRTLLQAQAVSALPSHRTIRSYGLLPDDIKLKTNISKWAITKFSQPINIKPFIIDDLEKSLVLEAPKKIISYYNPTNAPVNPVKPAAPRVRAPRAGVGKPNKRPTPEIASLYAREADGPPNKRINIDDDFEEEFIPNYIELKPIENRGPPPGLYPAITGIVDAFWDLEYEPHSVSLAFFGLINSKNCHEFELKDFADESCSLVVIKERIRSGYYNSASEFEVDFRRMFSNIMEYYPRTHPAYAKAVELLQLFELKWKDASSKLQ